MVNETYTFIEQQAYDWIVKLETGAMLNGDEERFIEWLSKDEAHGLAFAQAEQTWLLMKDASALPKLAFVHKSNDDTAEKITKRIPSKWQLWSLAASFLILSFTIIFGNSLWIPITADYYTSTGERAKHLLSDGSIITLNTGSAIEVSMNEASRKINVIAGEIYVAVAPDRQRPFVVKAGNMQVTALGTEFMVHKRQNQDSLVIVTEHSVKVENTDNSASSLVLDVGESVTLAKEQKQFSTKKKVNYLRKTAWLKGKYVFTEQSLGTVVTELSRYHKGKIVILDDSVKTLTLNGVLDLDEPYTSLQNLSYTLPIKVIKVTPYLILINKG